MDLSKPSTRPLTPHDRCDRCIQQAVAIAVLQNEDELLFCGHHARRHRTALLDNPVIAALGGFDLDPHTFGPAPTKENP